MNDKAIESAIDNLLLKGIYDRIELPARAKRHIESLVDIDTEKFDAAFAKEKDLYVGLKGAEGIEGRYERFQEFLKKGVPIDASEVGINSDGQVGFTNGRHRYAVMRDMGMKRIPVAMSKSSKRYAEELGLLATSGDDQIESAIDKIVEQSSEYLYHVTYTDQAKGILPMQTSNWVQAASKDRYGEGEIYAFEHIDDAIRWAAKMDWEFNKKFGSGEISIVRLRRTGDWVVDDNDPLGQAGASGQWLKRMGHVPSEDIEQAIPLTADMTKRLTAREDMSDVFA